MTPDIGLAVMTDIDDAAVFREELTHGVVTSDAAVLTEGYDNFVLEYGFVVNNDRLPWLVVRRSCRSELFECFSNTLHHMECARQSDAVAPQFELRRIGVELVVPDQHGLLCVVLGCSPIDDGVSVANF